MAVHVSTIFTTNLMALLRPSLLPSHSLILLLLFIIILYLYYRHFVHHSFTLPANTRLAPSPPRHFLLGHAPYLSCSRPYKQYQQWARTYGPIYRISPAGGRRGAPETFIVTSAILADELLRNRGGIYASRETASVATRILSGDVMGGNLRPRTTVPGAHQNGNGDEDDEMRPADSTDLRPFSFVPGPTLQQGRKLMYTVCRESAAKTYEPTQFREAVGMLATLIREPTQYEQWFVRFASGVILRVGYGRRILWPKMTITSNDGQNRDDKKDDPALARILAVNREFGLLGSSARDKWSLRLLEAFPFLVHLPSALLPVKRTLLNLHRMELSLYRDLQFSIRAQLLTSSAPECWERTYLERAHTFPELTSDQAAYVLGTMFAAGAHTAAAGMSKFLFAMVTHPWEWRALRKEMDAVVGGGGDGEDDKRKTRMPCFDDVPNLPRLRAAVKETLRWRPLPPDGVPHRVTEDDVVVMGNVLRSSSPTAGDRKGAAEGEKAAAEPSIFIPSGSLIQPIAWAIHRDPAVYPRGKEFLPERWLDDPRGEFPRTRLPEGRSLKEYPNLKNFSVFGYGRRICPGFNIVERSLVIQAALLVWGCEVRSLEAEGRGKGFVRAGNNDDDEDDDEDVFPPFELKVRGERYAEIIAHAAEKAEREDPLK